MQPRVLSTNELVFVNQTEMKGSSVIVAAVILSIVGSLLGDPACLASASLTVIPGSQSIRYSTFIHGLSFNQDLQY